MRSFDQLQHSQLKRHFLIWLGPLVETTFFCVQEDEDENTTLQATTPAARDGTIAA